MSLEILSNYVLEIVIGIYLLIATFTDLKTREVPDWLSFSLIPIVLAGKIIQTLNSGDYSILYNSLVGGLITAFFGAILFYTKQWGGADLKIFVSLGLFFGLSTSLLNYFIAFVLAGAIYGIGANLAIMINNWKSFWKYFIKDFNKNKKIITFFVVFFLIITFALFYYLYIQVGNYLFTILLVPFLLFIIYLTNIISTKFMIKKIPLNKLTEGDWVTQDIVIKGKKLYSAKQLYVRKEDIALMKKNKVKSVLVKYGIPFVPAIFLAYLIALFLDLRFMIF